MGISHSGVLFLVEDALWTEDQPIGWDIKKCYKAINCIESDKLPYHIIPSLFPRLCGLGTRLGTCTAMQRDSNFKPPSTR